MKALHPSGVFNAYVDDGFDAKLSVSECILKHQKIS
jgi:hypothetical protein